MPGHALHALHKPRGEHRLPHHTVHRPLLQCGAPGQEELRQIPPEVTVDFAAHLAPPPAAHHPHHGQQLRVLQQLWARRH